MWQVSPQECGACDEIARYVRDAVDHFRRAGAKGEHAQHLAAEVLGMTPRRIRSFLYGDVYSTAPSELAATRTARRAFAQRRIASLQAEIAAERAAFNITDEAA